MGPLAVPSQLSKSYCCSGRSHAEIATVLDGAKSAHYCNDYLGTTVILALQRWHFLRLFCHKLQNQFNKYFAIPRKKYFSIQCFCGHFGVFTIVRHFLVTEAGDSWMHDVSKMVMWSDTNELALVFKCLCEHHPLLVQAPSRLSHSYSTQSPRSFSWRLHHRSQKRTTNYSCNLTKVEFAKTEKVTLTATPWHKWLRNHLTFPLHQTLIPPFPGVNDKKYIENTFVNFEFVIHMWCDV